MLHNPMFSVSFGLRHNPMLSASFGLQFRSASTEAKRQDVVNRFAKAGYDQATLQDLLRTVSVPEDRITTLIAAAYPA